MASANFPTSLCPGYKHVEEFGPDDEYEEEVEEFYVTLDLGAVEPTLIPSSSTYRLIGLDSPTPFMQLSGTILQGRHESLLGTELLFTEAKVADPQDRTKRHLTFVSTTEQRVRFKEVQLRPKVPVQQAASAETPAPEEGPSNVVDRMTGKAQPTGKRTRKRKEKTGAADDDEKPRRRKSTRKGKAKAVEGEEEEESRNNEDDRLDEGEVGEKVSRKRSARKGKGKAKAVEEEQHNDGTNEPDEEPVV